MGSISSVGSLTGYVPPTPPSNQQKANSSSSQSQGTSSVTQGVGSPPQASPTAPQATATATAAVASYRSVTGDVVNSSTGKVLTDRDGDGDRGQMAKKNEGLSSWSPIQQQVAKLASANK